MAADLSWREAAKQQAAVGVRARASIGKANNIKLLVVPDLFPIDELFFFDRLSLNLNRSFYNLNVLRFLFS